MREYFAKHTNYMVIANTVLIDCKAIVQEGFRSQGAGGDEGWGHGLH